MRFQVPQFIEIEDKVVGPLTIKQFMYLAGGAGMAFVAWKFLPIFVSILFIAGIGALSLSLAFYKVNNKPFVDMLESAFSFYVGEKLYIWQKKDKKIEQRAEGEPASQRQVYVPKLSDSKLKELSWSLDIKDNVGGESRQVSDDNQ
jgi:hypothetical protein